MNTNRKALFRTIIYDIISGGWYFSRRGSNVFRQTDPQAGLSSQNQTILATAADRGIGFHWSDLEHTARNYNRIRTAKNSAKCKNHLENIF